MNVAFRPIKAVINLNALHQNLSQVKAYAPNSKVLAIIKANGYGHGIIRVASQLNKADGFGVASIDEAIVLRQKGFLHPIVILEGLFSEQELALAIQHRLDIAVHSFNQIEWLENCQSTVPMNLWIKLDTGMHRLGFSAEELQQVLLRVQNLSMPTHLHLMSHFASADESETVTLKQLECFNQMVGALPCAKSLSNSAGIQQYPQAHFDWVRPGIMLYGACASQQTVPNLKPVMTLISHLTSLKWIQAGESVGYGQTWTAERKSLIAVVAVGYGDGYPRHAPNGTPVLIQGRRMPLCGRVSMDMITVDVTDIAEKVSIGDEAILWGEGLPVDVVAQASGTIGYELLCGVTKRVPKIEVHT